MGDINDSFSNSQPLHRARSSLPSRSKNKLKKTDIKKCSLDRMYNNLNLFFEIN